MGRGTKAKPGDSGAKMNQRETRSASGKRNEANPGQSSVKRNQGETRSVQCEKESGGNQVKTVGRGTKAKHGLHIKTPFPLLIYTH